MPALPIDTAATDPFGSDATLPQSDDGEALTARSPTHRFRPMYLSRTFTRTPCTLEAASQSASPTPPSLIVAWFLPLPCTTLQWPSSLASLLPRLCRNPGGRLSDRSDRAGLRGPVLPFPPRRPIEKMPHAPEQVSAAPPMRSLARSCRAVR